MPIRSISDLRKWAGAGWEDASDEDLLSSYAKATDSDPARIASRLGYDLGEGGISAKQLSSSIDRYQAGLYGVGEAIAQGVGAEGASDWLAKRRRANEFQADVASSRARAMGAVDEWKNVHDLSDAGSYIKSTGMQSLPYAAEALIGGLGVRTAMSGTRAALTAAETANDLAAAAKAKRALNIGSEVGGVAASYPSAVGDVLSNQREQSDGQTRGGVAAALAIPYAALNAVGLESAVMRGSLFKNSVSLLDRKTGLTGAAARAGATATGVGLKEGASETGQEMLNQVGRMSVDKSENFFSDAAQERFKESFIGGALLGGAAGGTLGGWRRSSNDVSQAIASDDQSKPPLTTNQFTPPQTPPPGGTVTPNAPTPPAVNGGSTDIALAQQQAQIQDEQVKRAQQQEQTRSQTIDTFKISTDPARTEGQFLGFPLRGAQRVNAVADAMAAATAHYDQVHLDIANAIQEANAATSTPDAKSKLLTFSFNADNINKSVENGLNAIAKVATKFQIDHVDSVEQAAEILNTLSNSVPKGQLEQVNAIHQALTGEDTSGFIASQQSKVAKGAKNVQQPKLQTTTGLGEVPVQGTASQTVDGGAGPVRPTQVQSVGAGSLGEGSLGLQAGQLSAEGIRAGASGNAVTNDVGQSTQNAQVSGAQNATTAEGTISPSGSNTAGGQETTVATTAPGSESTTANAQVATTDAAAVADEIENSLEGTPTLIRRMLRMIYPKSGDGRIELYAAFMSRKAGFNTQTETYEELGKRYGLKPSTVKDYVNKDLKLDPKEGIPLFMVRDREKIKAALISQAQAMGLDPQTMLDATTTLLEREIAASEAAGVTDEIDLIVNGFAIQNTKERLDKEGKGTGKIDRTNVTDLAEEGKTMESLMQQYADLSDELEAAKSANTDKVGELQKQVDELTEKITAAETREKQRVRDLAKQTAEEEDVTEGGAKKKEVDDTNPFEEAKAEEERKQREAQKQADRKGFAVGDTVVNAKLGTGVIKKFIGTGTDTRASIDFQNGTTKELLLTVAKLEKTNAVQKQSTDEGNVRQPTGGGEAVVKVNAEPKKLTRARKAKTEVQLVEKAKQEIKTPEEQWTALAEQFPMMPPYESLDKDEKIRWDDVASRGVANLAAANTVLTTTVKAGTTEAPSITGDAKTLAPEVEKLTEGQTTRLEQHYGAQRGTDEFFTKLGEDVVAYASKGAEAVSAAIRDIVRILAQGVLAAAIVVNPTLAKMNFQFNLPRVVSQTSEVRAVVPAAAKAKMSEAAQVTYSAVAPIAKAANKAFMITDKTGGMLHVFHADGSLLVQDVALVGKDVGDKLEGAKKITPAGQYDLHLVPDAEYTGGFVYHMGGAVREDGLTVAVHAVYTGEASEKRPERLATPTPTDNRISWGCINVNNSTMVDTLLPAKAEINGSLIFVMPENSKDIAKFFPAMTQTIETTEGSVTGKAETRSVVAKEEERLASKSKSFYAVEDLAADFDGVDAANKQLEDMGIGHAMDYVSDWETINDTAEDAINGEIVSQGGRYKVVLNQAKLTSSAHAVETVTHEVGHAVDMAPHGGIYSGQPEMSVVVKDGKITPVGVVAREMHNLYNTDAGWNDYLEYPFDTAKFKELNNHVVVEGELFAQLFSVYVNPKGRAKLEKVAPQTAAFMAEVIKHVQSTRSLQIQTATTAAQRTLTFKNRNASRGSQTSLGPVQKRREDETTSLIDSYPRQLELLFAATTAKNFFGPTKNNNDLIAKVTGYALANPNSWKSDLDLTNVDAAAIQRFLKWAIKQQSDKAVSFASRSASFSQGLDNYLPPAAAKPAKSVVTTIVTAARNGLLGAAITEDVVNMASKYMRSAKDYLSAQYARQKTRLEFEMRIERILENFDKLPKNLQGTGVGSVNRYILDSTMQRKWGYYPGEHRIGTQLFEADPDLQARFDAFPDDAQQLIKDVFEHGYTALELKKNAVSKAVEREFAERERAAIGDADALAELQKERKQMVAKLTKLQNIDFTVPYAYLGRYGDYIVVAKSKEFKHWEERANPKMKDFDYDRAVAWMRDNVSNPDHYVVQFVETQGEADQLASELMATGKYDMDGTEAGPKEANQSYIGSDLHLAVSRVRNIAEREKSESSPELDKLLSNLYLLTAAENSARKSEIARKYVYGANENMMRNLATSGRADAHFLSTMEHNDAITESLENMRTEARRNYKEAMPLYNELYIRQANSMDYNQPALLSRALTQATSLWFLSTSPAFYLQQILQTGVLSLPYMAGRLGYFRSARAIKTAYSDIAGLVKGLGVNDHVDFSKAPADVRGMLQTLVGMGKIDISIDSDAKARAGEQGTLGKVVRKLQGVNNRIETINRATAAIAAYRGYLQRFGANNTDAATKFAAEVVSNSHGSYDGFNTPRVLTSDVGRVVGQFKRFQIIQLSMLAKLIHSSFKGASAEEKMVARRALAFITGHMAVLGGALGVPFVMQIGNLLVKLFGDEDEPDDLEYKLRQAIGDKALADLLLNGVPAAMGVNLGGKLGMGNVASILPFTDVDLSSRSGYEKAMVGMLGPFIGGLAPKFIDGAGMIGKGEYYKGLELLMPNGIGNAMKGVRYASEGITMRNGDVVMRPEDISIVDAAFQAVGLPTTTITNRQYVQRTKAEFDKFYNDKTSSIKGAYASASFSGDSEAMADARQEWENLQESRRRNGYKIQPMSELFKSVSAAGKRQASVVNGVETTKNNRQFVANII